jgi:hypothetical protein
MIRITHRAVVLSIAAVSLLVTACSSPGTTTTSSDEDQRSDGSYSNFLVIGVAGNYTNRAQFERTLASALRSKGVSASTYYSVVKGNQALEREAIVEAVKTHGFDAVLLTRVLSQDVDVSQKTGSSETQTSRKNGNLANFFRYDYEELNTPATIDLTTTTVLTSELFSAADEEVVWAYEFTSPASTDVGRTINYASETILKRLNRDRLISR